MGQRVDHATVQQADVGDAEVRVHRRAIAAVGVLQHRRLAVARHVLAVHQRHRDLRLAIPRRRPHALGDVLRRVVARHGLLLQLAAFAGLGVDLVGRGRRGHRGVAVAQPVGTGFRIGRQAHRVRRLVGLDVVATAVGLDHAQAFQRVGAFGHHAEAVEQFETLDEHVVAVRHPVLPVLARSRVGRRGHDLEVGGAIGVGADHPAVA